MTLRTLIVLEISGKTIGICHFGRRMCTQQLRARLLSMRRFAHDNNVVNTSWASCVIVDGTVFLLYSCCEIVVSPTAATWVVTQKNEILWRVSSGLLADERNSWLTVYIQCISYIQSIFFQAWYSSSYKSHSPPPPHLSPLPMLGLWSFRAYEVVI